MISARTLKMAAFSYHFVINEYGDLSFFSSSFEQYLSVKEKYGLAIFSADETIVGNVNLADRYLDLADIFRNYCEYTRCCYSYM